MRTLIQHLRWNGPIHQKLQTIKTHQRWNRCPNHHLTIKEVDFINPSKEKSPDPDDFISEFRQTFQELTPTLNNLFQKKEEKGTSLNYFIRSASPYVKTRQGHYKLRKLQIKISQEYRHKNS